jgi:hypothetical protein
MELEKRKPWYDGYEITYHPGASQNLTMGQFNQFIVTIMGNTNKFEVSSLDDRQQYGKPKLMVHPDIRSLEGVIFPPTLIHFSLNRNPFIKSLRNVNFADSFITHLNLSYCAISSITGIVFPPMLINLHLSNNQIQVIAETVFPPTLEVLNLQQNYIETLNGFIFPNRLTQLFLAQNYIVSLDNIIFPKYLTNLSLSQNPIQSIRGTRFPKHLPMLDNDIPTRLFLDWVDPESKELTDRIQSLTEQTANIPILQNRIDSLLEHVANLTNSVKILLQEKATQKIEEYETENTKRLISSVIFVRLMDGRNVTIRYQDVQTIGDIIEYLKQHYFLGLTFAKPVLSFNKTLLDPLRSLADYNIQNESTLYLLNRSVGGSNKKKSHFRKNRNNRKKSKIN